MARDVKICYVAVDVAVPHVRGASTHIFEVSRHLVQLGHEVHLISRRIHPAQLSYEVLDGVYVHRLYRGIIAPLPLSSYQQLERSEENHLGLLGKFYESYLFLIYPFYAGLIATRIIKKHDIDVIVERETSFGAGAIASTVTKKPMVLELIGPRYSRLSFKKSMKILAYTKSMIRNPTSLEKLVFVNAAVDVEKFKPNSAHRKFIREKYGFHNSIVVGYVGTFAKWHGIEELVEASTMVLERFSNVRFLMVGPYFQYAEELVHKKRTPGAYVFTGPVSYADVSKYINASDILVAPYNPAKSELRRKYGIGSPLKVFEYMACGKPVITTSVPPIVQVVENGKTGILVPTGNSLSLAEAIVHLIEEPELRKRIGEVAREKVEKHYSWKTFSLNLEEVLQEAVKAA